MLDFKNAASANSESDETTICSDGDGDRDKDLGVPAVGVPSPEDSPRMGHALLSMNGVEVQEGLRNLHQRWRLEDNIDDTDALKTSSGESCDLVTVS